MWIKMLLQMVLSFFYLRMPNLVTCHGGVAPKICVCSHLLLKVFTEVISVFSWLLVLLLLCQYGGKARTCMRPSTMLLRNHSWLPFAAPEYQDTWYPHRVPTMYWKMTMVYVHGGSCSKDSLAVSQAVLGLLEQT